MWYKYFFWIIAGICSFLVCRHWDLPNRSGCQIATIFSALILSSTFTVNCPMALCVTHFFSFVWNIRISFDWIDKFLRVFNSMKNHWCFRAPLCLFVVITWVVFIGLEGTKKLEANSCEKVLVFASSTLSATFGYLFECGRSLVRLLRLFLEDWEIVYFRFKCSKTLKASFSSADVSCNSMFQIHGVNNIVSLPQRRKEINDPTASKTKFSYSLVVFSVLQSRCYLT